MELFDLQKWHSSLTDIPIEDLLVDLTYQRPTIASLLDRLYAVFDSGLMDPLHVNQRLRHGDHLGYYVFDGWHRRTVQFNQGYRGALPCMVSRGQSPEWEAAMFKLLNETRKKVKPMIVFASGLKAGDIDCHAISDALADVGIVLADKRTESELFPIQCVSAMTSVYDRGGKDAVRLVAQTSVAAWGFHKYGFNSPVVLALGEIIPRAGKEDYPTVERLARTLGEVGWRTITDEVSDLVRRTGCTHQQANMATALANIWRWSPQKVGSARRNLMKGMKSR